MGIQRIIHPRLVIILLVLLFPAALAFSSSETAGNDQWTVSGPVIQAKLTSTQALQDQDPISIMDNDDFKDPANGFTTDATGTFDDPYVLKGKFINATGGEQGINITGTDVYFRIENVWVNGSDNLNTAGIQLTDVTNGQLINCTVTESYAGIGLIRSSNNNLTVNNVTGATIGFALTDSSNDNNLSWNNATGNGYGYFMNGSSHNNLIGNNASENGNGFYLYQYNTYNTFTGNNANRNTKGFLLSSYNNYNTFTGNTVNGNGYTEDGFKLSGYSNYNTFTGNNATGNEFGFYLSSSNSNTFTGNEASGNNYEGFTLDSSDNNTLAGNDATDNGGLGFLLGGSYNNTLTGNDASGNDVGFLLDTAVNNTLTGNNASGNNYGFLLGDSNNNTLTGNEASGNTIDGIYLDYSDNNTLTGNNASWNNLGFDLFHSHNNTLTGNTANNNIGAASGFLLWISSNNTLIGNTANDNNVHGFDLYSSSNNNTLIGNTATSNEYGFYLTGSSNSNNLTANTATENNRGFYLTGSSNYNTLTANNATSNEYGFYLEGSSFNTLTANSACDNVVTNGITVGGFVLVSSSHNNTLTGNYAGENSEGFHLASSSNYNNLTWNIAYSNTGYGISLRSSSGNLLYYNFLIDNFQGGTLQAYDDSLTNSWNSSTRGNYWSDHYGPDDDSNGIVDSSYTLAGGQQVNDTLPLASGLLASLSTLQLTGPADRVFEAGSTGILSLTWLPVTNIPVNTTYKLYLDDDLDESGNWTSGAATTLSVDLTGASLGDYNITLVVSDYSNKTATHTVWVTVEDTVDPVIAAIIDFTVEAGPDAGVLTFSATDLFPATYTLYLDGAVNKTDSWTSGTVVTFPLDSLPPGVYTFTLAVRDTTGNDDTLTVTVTVIDTTNPVITYTGPSTFTFEEDSTGNTFTLSATDLFPGNYTVYRDDYPVFSGNWTNGTVFTVSLDDLPLPPGEYTIKLVVHDTSGNEAILTVTVTVTAKPAPSTTPTTPTTASTTTTRKPSPGWTAPLVLLSLACSAFILTRRRSRQKK
ncbi:MAG: NosD domain-containing protein [Candidatus Odinarchaeota archaeon]